MGRWGGLVWYPYSVSQIRLAPKSRATARRRLGSVAIVSVWQLPQPPLHGVSVCGLTGYGLCAYASRRAPPRAIPSIQSREETPPAFPPGAVTPPPPTPLLFTAWVAPE